VTRKILVPQCGGMVAQVHLASNLAQLLVASNININKSNEAAGLVMDL
jgi:hypothetical protein